MIDRRKKNIVAFVLAAAMGHDEDWVCNLRRDFSVVDMRNIIVSELSREYFSKCTAVNRRHVAVKEDKFRDVDLVQKWVKEVLWRPS